MMCKMSKRQRWHLQMAPADSVPPNCLLIHSKWLAPCTFYQPPSLFFFLFALKYVWSGCGFGMYKNTVWYQNGGIKEPLRLCHTDNLMNHGTRLWQNSNRDTLPSPAVVSARRSHKPGGLESKHLLPDSNQNQKIHLNEALNQPTITHHHHTHTPYLLP